MWSRQDHLHNRTHICMWFEFIGIIHFELIGFIYIIKNDNQQHSISASNGAYLRPSLNVTIQDFHSFEFATLNQCNCSLLLRFNRPLRLPVPSRAAKYFYSKCCCDPLWQFSPSWVKGVKVKFWGGKRKEKYTVILALDCLFLRNVQISGASLNKRSQETGFKSLLFAGRLCWEQRFHMQGWEGH